MSIDLEQLQDFVEELAHLYEVKTKRFGRGGGDSQARSLLTWRTMPYDWTLQRLSASDNRWSEKTNEIILHTGHPRAVREFLQRSRGTHLFHWHAYSTEELSSEVLTNAATSQQLLPAWSDDVKKLLGFLLLREKVVTALYFHELSLMKSGGLRSELTKFGSSKRLERSRPISTPNLQKRTQTVSKSKVTEFSKWCTHGQKWISTLRQSPQSLQPVLQYLFDSGHQRPTGDKKFPSPPSNDWLDEILARTIQTRTVLKFAPQWPSIFESEDLRILIFVIENQLVSWVKKKSSFAFISINLTSLEVSGRKPPGGFDIPHGLTLSWYIDSCIALRRVSHPHFRSAGVAARSRATQALPYIRHLPTSSFYSDLAAIREGSRVAPKAHKVRGHPRKLSPDRTPRDSSRANAPLYIRRHLASDETFVRAHTRAGERHEIDWKEHLSKFSSLADALGGLK